MVWLSKLIYLICATYSKKLNDMKKFVITTILFSLTTLFLWAIPAKRIAKTYTQPDGSTVTVVLQGDEHFHYYTTTDGVMVAEDSDGYFKYAIANNLGNIVAGKYIARNPEKRTQEETEYIVSRKQELKATVKSKRAKVAAKRSIAKASQFPNTGKIKGLIILVQFKDNTFSTNETNEQFTRMMNEENYNDFGATGSARDYFLAQSNNRFLPDFTVVGPVTLPQNMSYYGSNDSYYDQDQNPEQMVIDACRAVDADVDFSEYDFDEDGKVDLVYIIYAGYGESQGAPANTIWPHAWSLTDARKTLMLDEKNIDSYACSSELSGSRGSDLDGIGTFCHEFSHCLGFPDVYDTADDGYDTFGMDAWDLMDYGSYNNDSKTPAGYSAYEKAFLGWIELEELEKGSYTLSAFNTSNKAYKITSPYNENEFFTLENRQNTGWDAALPGNGLVVTHFDYNESVWANNSVNNEFNHPRWQIVPSNGWLSPNVTTCVECQAYPGPYSKTSIPSFSVFTGDEIEKPITNIVETNGIITFDFMMGMLQTPVALPATDMTSTGFTANWEAVEDAESYTLEVKKVQSGELLLSEDFSKFKDGSISSPNSTDVSTKLNTYMQTEGWTGSKIFQAGGVCKMASKSAAGYLITPVLDLSTSSGTVTITMKAQGKTAGELTIALFSSPSSSIAAAEQKINITTDNQEVSCMLESNLSTGYITISTISGKVVFIDDITIYGGEVVQKVQSVNNDTQTITVPGTETSYAVTGLEANGIYKYTVKAHAGNGESAYSNSITVNLDPSSIGCCTLVKAYSAIYTHANEIIIVATENAMANIYSIDGMLKQSTVIEPGDNRIEMSNGIYIIRIGNSSTKVVISAKYR